MSRSAPALAGLAGARLPAPALPPPTSRRNPWGPDAQTMTVDQLDFERLFYHPQAVKPRPEMTGPDERPEGRHQRKPARTPLVRPARPVLRRVATVAVSLACLTGVGACQKEQPVPRPSSSPPRGQSDATVSGCDVRPGDVSVLKGGTLPVDAAATIRAGLQYEVSQSPLTWKVMFLADGGSVSHDLKRGDTVSVAGQTITVRDACTDRVVLTLGSTGDATGGPASTG